MSRDTPSPAALGLSMKLARIAARQPLGAAALGLGVDRHTLTEWEAGKNLPNMGQALALAQQYGTDLATLLGVGSGLGADRKVAKTRQEA